MRLKFTGKNKITKLILLAIVILSIALGMYHIRYKLIYHFHYYTIILLDKQKVVIELPAEIDANTIMVKWYGKSADPLVFSGNHDWQRIPLAIGNNSFAVFYDDSLLTTVGHLKYSKYSYHNYFFKFNKNGADISFTFKVQGPDSSSVKDWDELYHWTKGLSRNTQDYQPIELLPTNKLIRNIIDFQVDTADYHRLVRPFMKTKIKKTIGKINNKTINVKTLKTRGQSSMRYKRKSFNVTLKDSVLFADEHGVSLKLKKFSLLSLSMDHYYFRNKLALDLLKALKLMNIFYCFSEVKINSETQGLYLIIENPQKYLFDKKMASFILRRRYEYSSFTTDDDTNADDYDYDNKKLSHEAISYYLDQYKQIYKLARQKAGNELYQSLNKIMDIDEYMRFMAFNFILCNADYTDELFFYNSTISHSKKFSMMAWDFDDILFNAPHEGWPSRNKQIQKDRLIFSIENELDLTIAKDEFLYEKYLSQLQEMINRLENTDLKAIYQNIYNQLYPFFCNKNIMQQSIFDQSLKEYNITKLESQLIATYGFLLQRIRQISSQLNERRNIDIKNSN